MDALSLCEPLHACLLARASATRHALDIASGRGRGAPRLDYCAQCPIGARRLGELEDGGWRRPADTLPAETLDSPQRLARDRWRRSFPSYAEPGDERLNPVRELALLFPHV